MLTFQPECISDTYQMSGVVQAKNYVYIPLGAAVQEETRYNGSHILQGAGSTYESTDMDPRHV